MISARLHPRSASISVTKTPNEYCVMPTVSVNVRKTTNAMATPWLMRMLIGLR